MKKVIDVNVEEHQLSDKILINSKNIDAENFTEIKCFKNFEEVTSLEAKKINLIKIQKTIFLNLSNLQILDLRENKLFKISKNLKSLKHLRHLKLDDNNITYLPNFIGNMEKLETLTISSNKLKMIPTSIQYLQKLKTLKLSNNQITTLPIEFGLLKSLECLYIDANHFTEIPTTLCYLKHLSELSFEWLEFIDPPFQKLIKENIGKTIITLIRNSLQEMIKQNFLYCDILTFIQKNSNSNSRRESSNKIEGGSLGINKNECENKEFKESMVGGIKISTGNSFVVNGVTGDAVYNSSPMEGKVNKKSTSQLVGSGRKEEKLIFSTEGQLGQTQNLANISNKEFLQNQKKFLKIFYAIENNYYGVIKGLISSNEEYLRIKNGDNKTPLYLAIQNNKVDITNLILTNIDFNNIPNSHIYLHKAIRMRDPILTQKLIEMGIDINASDDQGATCLHILFSTFTKQFYKCSVIGDILLRYNPRLNVLNNDNWAPIHIASRRSAIECIIWIINQNKILKSQGKETFDINIRGKNKWTPLHLAVNGFRLEETLLLLDNGSDVFAKNSDGKKPRKVANGNFLLTKLLRNYEQNIFTNKFYLKNEKNSQNVNNNNCFTTVEDTSNIGDISSFLKPPKSTSPIPKESLHTTFKNGDENERKSCQSGSVIHSINSINSKPNKSSNRINLIPAPNKPNLKPKSTNFNKNSIPFQNKINFHFHKEIILSPDNSLAEKYESLMYIRMVSSPYNQEIENIIKSLLESIDLDVEINKIIFADIINLTIANQFFNLIPFLEMLQRTVNKKKNMGFIEMEILSTISILKATQESLRKTVLLHQDVHFNTSESVTRSRRNKKFGNNKNPKEGFNFKANSMNPKMSIKHSQNNYKNVNFIPKISKITCYFDGANNSSKQNSRGSSRRNSRQNSQNIPPDDFDYNEMNEVSRSLIDINNYQNQIPRKMSRGQKNTKNTITMTSNNYTGAGNDESCNVVDSSWSMARYDNDNYNEDYLPSQYSAYTLNKTEDGKCIETVKPDEEYFTVAPPKKINSNLFDVRSNG